MPCRQFKPTRLNSQLTILGLTQLNASSLLGGKDAYIAWVASVAPALQAPTEVKRIASYDNYNGVTLHRLVEFEFDNIEEANTYLEREEVHAVNVELPNRASRAAQLMFVLRSDYVNE